MYFYKLRERLRVSRMYTNYYKPGDEVNARRLVDSSFWNDKAKFESKADEWCDRFVYPYLTTNSPLPLALDYGCGVGRITRRIAPYFKEVVACDVSPEMIEFAKVYLKGIDNLTFIRVNGTNLEKVKKYRFNRIFSFLVFQHMRKRDTLSIMTAMSRILCKDGLLIASFSRQGVDDLEELTPNKNLVQHSREEILSLHKQAELEIKVMEEGLYIVTVAAKING